MFSYLTVFSFLLIAISADPMFLANSPSDNAYIESMRGFVMYQIVNNETSFITSNLGSDNVVQFGSSQFPALLRLSTANCPYPQAQTESWSAIEFPGNGGKLRHRDLVVHSDTTVSGPTYDFAWKFIKTGDDDGSYYVGNPYGYSNEIDWYLGSDGNGEVTLVQKNQAPKWFIKAAFFANTPARNSMIESRGEFRLYTVVNGQKMYVQKLSAAGDLVSIGAKSTAEKLKLSKKECPYTNITETEVWSAITARNLKLRHRDYVLEGDDTIFGPTYDYAWKFVATGESDGSYYIYNPFQYTDMAVYFLGIDAVSNHVTIEKEDQLIPWYIEFYNGNSSSQNDSRGSYSFARADASTESSSSHADARASSNVYSNGIYNSASSSAYASSNSEMDTSARSNDNLGSGNSGSYDPNNQNSEFTSSANASASASSYAQSNFNSGKHYLSDSFTIVDSSGKTKTCKCQ